MPNTTKAALEESLKRLLLKKPLDKITITDITTDCGISRMAFYYHFKDIYDLGYFDDVQVKIDELPDGVRLTFVVKEKPRISAISAPPKRTLSATDQNCTCSGIP